LVEDLAIFGKDYKEPVDEFEAKNEFEEDDLSLLLDAGLVEDNKSPDFLKADSSKVPLDLLVYLYLIYKNFADFHLIFYFNPSYMYI